MQLTQFTNYSFRVLMYAALSGEKPVSVKEIADTYGISFNHLKKVVVMLIEHKYLAATRGRYGGVTLAKDPKDINVGKVVRQMEPSLCLFECFDKKTEQECPLVKVCVLKKCLHEALKSFMEALDSQTLQDLIDGHGVRAALLG